MSGDDSGRRTAVRYQPDDKPPLALSFGLGLQLAILVLAGIVLIPTVVVRAAGGSEAYLAWVVFAAVAVCGLTTALQALRIGRLGAGYILVGGSSGAFIAVCVTAIAEGGPALLATLVVIGSLFQFALSARLSLFRRILTPTVAGTVVMLLPVTVMPIVFAMLDRRAGGEPGAGRSVDRPGDPGCHRRHRAEGDGGAAPLGADHRGCRRLAGRRGFRSLRDWPHQRGFVARPAEGGMAGFRSRLHPDLLGAASRLHVRGPDRHRPHDQLGSR